jgi:hypothetical protein
MPRMMSTTTHHDDQGHADTLADVARVLERAAVVLHVV